MNWKRFLLIGIAVAGFALIAPTRSDAGVSIGIGVGLPGFYGYGYPAYSYGSYDPYYYRPYYRPVVYVSPGFYWHNGHRVYYHHRRYHRR
jgi:hypothetical protein